jgi:hypothetical protein
MNGSGVEEVKQETPTDEHPHHQTVSCQHQQPAEWAQVGAAAVKYDDVMNIHNDEENWETTRIGKVSWGERYGQKRNKNM